MQKTSGVLELKPPKTTFIVLYWNTEQRKESLHSSPGSHPPTALHAQLPCILGRGNCACFALPHRGASWESNVRESSRVSSHIEFFAKPVIDACFVMCPPFPAYCLSRPLKERLSRLQLLQLGNLRLPYTLHPFVSPHHRWNWAGHLLWGRPATTVKGPASVTISRLLWVSPLEQFTRQITSLGWTRQREWPYMVRTLTGH